MRKLLRANFSRLFRDKLFYILCAVMLAAGAGIVVIHYFDNLANGENWTPDSTCFTYAYLVPIMLSLLTALFVGSEYSDGTIRNKLAVGHRRSAVYLSNLITCAAAGLLLCAAYAVPHTCLSAALLGEFDSAPSALILRAGVSLALTAAFAAVFVLIAMLCQNKAYSTAGCILLVFALLFSGVRLCSALNEPEYRSGYSYTESGVTAAEEPEPNPHYLNGAKRQAVDFLYDFTSGGQVIQLGSAAEVENPAILALYDGIILLAATVCGTVIFRRRDLK